MDEPTGRSALTRQALGRRRVLALGLGTLLLSACVRPARVPCEKLVGTSCPGADLRGRDLHGANLRWADLREADLRGANLREVHLYGAVLSQADLSGADLRGANLRGFDRAGLWYGMYAVALDSVTYDRHPRWPEGYKPEVFGAYRVD